MAGLPTQVLTKMISKVDSRLRDLVCLVELNLGGVVAEREACRLIVADGEGGRASIDGAAHNGHHQIRFGLHSFRAPEIPEESQ